MASVSSGTLTSSADRQPQHERPPAGKPALLPDFVEAGAAQANHASAPSQRSVESVSSPGLSPALLQAAWAGSPAPVSGGVADAAGDEVIAPELVEALSNTMEHMVTQMDVVTRSLQSFESRLLLVETAVGELRRSHSRQCGRLVASHGNEGGVDSRNDVGDELCGMVDTNRDGVISRSELRELTRAPFL